MKKRYEIFLRIEELEDRIAPGILVAAESGDSQTKSQEGRGADRSGRMPPPVFQIEPL